MREVSIEHCNGCGMPTEDAYSSGHLVLSHFGACKCSNVETNISWTCLVSGLLSFEHPSVLLFLLLQRDTSDQDNSQNLGYWFTIRHRCTCMWSWTEMLIFSFQLRAKTVWTPLRMSTEICRPGEGHNLWPSECRLSVGKPFLRRPRKCCRLETLAC